MALALPRFAVMQKIFHETNFDETNFDETNFHETRYLSYIHEDTEFHGCLRFSRQDIVSPFVKFAIERAKSPTAAGNGLVNIRCCYNNKYWVVRSSSDSCIIAGADEPNEDQSQLSCTLFKPIRIDGEGGSGSTNTTVQFLHVQLQRYLTYRLDDSIYPYALQSPYVESPQFPGSMHNYNFPMPTHLMRFSSRDHRTPYPNYQGMDYPRTPRPPPHMACLYSDSESTSSQWLDVFQIRNWESLLILPKHIALKGDNGLYLSARRIERHKYLQFASSDNGDPTVGNEVFITEDGSVRIKNNHFKKFWRRSPNWIWADSDDTTINNLDTLFSPVKVGDNVIALRNLGNNNFCKRLTTEGKTSCLNAATTTISNEARFVVEELVISRKIYNVNFRLSDARIYNQNIITMVTKTATNTTQVSNTATLKLLHRETRSTTWNGSVSLKLGVKTSIQTGVPCIAQGLVEVSTEFTGTYQWGETMSTENEVETEYTTTVPPMSKVTVRLLATQGSCNIPFSYTQHDTLMNGEQVIYNYDDGVYTGINSFNFFYDTKQEKLG